MFNGVAKIYETYVGKMDFIDQDRGCVGSFGESWDKSLEQLLGGRGNVIG